MKGQENSESRLGALGWFAAKVKTPSVGTGFRLSRLLIKVGSTHLPGAAQTTMAQGRLEASGPSGSVQEDSATLLKEA